MTLKQSTEAIIAELGLMDLPENARMEVVARVGEVMVRSVAAAVLSRLPLEARREFEALSSGGDAKALDALMRAHIKDFDSFVADESRKALAEFKGYYAKALAA